MTDKPVPPPRVQLLFVSFFRHFQYVRPYDAHKHYIQILHLDNYSSRSANATDLCCPPVQPMAITN